MMYPGPAMGQGRMPAGTSRAPVRSRSLNTERLNATAVNMLAEFLRTNHPTLAPMAFEFWTIADAPLDRALAHLFRAVHKPGIPAQHHNGPLDYSATTLKSYFSSLSRVFAANRPAPRGFHSEPFKSGVAVALEKRIREMSAEARALLAGGGGGISGGGGGGLAAAGFGGRGARSGGSHPRGGGGGAIETAKLAKSAAARPLGHVLAASLASAGVGAASGGDGGGGQRHGHYAARSGGDGGGGDGKRAVKKQADAMATSGGYPTNSRQFDGLGFGSSDCMNGVGGGGGVRGGKEDDVEEMEEDEEEDDDVGSALLGLNGLSPHLSGSRGGGGGFETPVVPDNHFIMMWNAVSSGSDPIKHLLRLFLTAATLFGDANSFLANMRVSDFVIETISEGEYIGRSALVLHSRTVAKRARAAALKLAEDAAQTCPASAKSDAAARIISAATAAAAADADEDTKAGLHYIVDMPEMGDGNNYYVLKEYMDCRPPGAGDNFWLNCSRDRTAPRDSFYSPTVMSVARIGSLIDELYAETAISNTLGCLNHSLHLRIMPKVGGGGAAGVVGGRSGSLGHGNDVSETEPVVRRGRGRPRSVHPVAHPVSAATAFRRAADRRASLSADGARRVPPPVPSVELIVKLGGAALTDKANRRELAPMERFDGSVSCVADAYKHGTRMIVCMGAGSYGHFEAAECKVAGGGASTQGVSSTHAAVSVLAAFVVDLLSKKGVPAVIVSPLHVVLCGSTLERAVANALNSGFVPVIHGDAMFDAGTATSSIFSGDDALAQLAMSATFPNIRRAVFVSDVAGVFKQPPPPVGGPGREMGAIFGGDGAMDASLNGLVRNVVVDSDGNSVPGSCSVVTKRADARNSGGIEGQPDIKTGEEKLNACPDVTGGMGKKLACAGSVAGKTKGRVVVYIVGAGSSSMAAAMDVRSDGTRLVADNCTRVVYQGQNAEEWRQKEDATCVAPPPSAPPGSGPTSAESAAAVVDSADSPATDAAADTAADAAADVVANAAEDAAAVAAIASAEAVSAVTAAVRGSDDDVDDDDVDNDAHMGVDDSDSVDDIGGKLSGGIGPLPSDMFAAVTTS